MLRVTSNKLLKKNIKPGLLFFCIAILNFISCKDTASNSYDESYKAAKETLGEKEKNSPLKFLSVTGDNNKNFLGTTVTRGTIHNNATLCSYKDVRIKMICFDNKGKMLEEHEDVIKEVIKPNNSKKFITRYHLPKSTDSIALSLMSAVVADEKE